MSAAKVRFVGEAMRADDDERGMMPASERWYDRARVGLAASKQWNRDRLSRRLNAIGRIFERESSTGSQYAKSENRDVGPTEAG